MNSSDIQAWLTRKGVYNCLVEVDGKTFKVNLSQGVQLASDEDAWMPKYEPPDWLAQIIRSRSDRP